MINAKDKGNRRERQVVALLEKAGYFVCKSGGSLGLFDIIAINPLGVRCIQVKSNRPPGPAERETLQLFVTPPGCTKELWVIKDGDTKPLITYL